MEKTNEMVYRERSSDICHVLLIISNLIVGLEDRASAGDFPLGEYGDALKHLVYAAHCLGADSDVFKEIAKRNGIDL